MKEVNASSHGTLMSNPRPHVPRLFDQYDGMYLHRSGGLYTPEE